jgi:hypothetical protein
MLRLRSRDLGAALVGAVVHGLRIDGYRHVSVRLQVGRLSAGRTFLAIGSGRFSTSGSRQW